jgi:hypothetical protein
MPLNTSSCFRRPRPRLPRPVLRCCRHWIMVSGSRCRDSARNYHKRGSQLFPPGLETPASVLKFIVKVTSCLGRQLEEVLLGPVRHGQHRVEDHPRNQPSHVPKHTSR